MNFSRYKTLRRDFGTTLLLVGLSLALSPEVRATDEFEEDINRTDLFDHSALKSELKESSVIKDTGRHGSERSDEIVDRDQMDLVDYFTGLLIGGLFGLGAGHAIHENPRAKYFFVIDAVSYSGLFFAAYSFNEDRLSDEIFKLGAGSLVTLMGVRVLEILDLLITPAAQGRLVSHTEELSPTYALMPVIAPGANGFQLVGRF